MYTRACKPLYHDIEPPARENATSSFTVMQDLQHDVNATGCLSSRHPQTQGDQIPCCQLQSPAISGQLWTHAHCASHPASLLSCSSSELCSEPFDQTCLKKEAKQPCFTNNTNKDTCFSYPPSIHFLFLPAAPQLLFSHQCPDCGCLKNFHLSSFSRSFFSERQLRKKKKNNPPKKTSFYGNCLTCLKCQKT